MRPVFSPSEFIQMKGRGTRIFDFTECWISKNDIPEIDYPEKQSFKLFDYFHNYHYFENEFNYDEKLKLVKTVPYRNNYGYFFSSGPNTWHGMEKKEIKKERRCVQVNYVSFNTDWKVRA